MSATMKYLYLNFLANLNDGSRNTYDFYNKSLKEQYAELQRRLENGLPQSFQEFIERIFLTQVSKAYYISFPSLDRTIKKDSNDNECIFNIVIRPDSSKNSPIFISKGYDLIIIGDLIFDSVTYVKVKGLELIDRNTAKFGEKKISCYCANSFSKKELYNGLTVLDYGTSSMKEPILTRDFIMSLFRDCFPVPEPHKAIKTLNEWTHYLNFRNYFLNKQSERCEEFSSISVCNSFLVTKEIFRKNEEKLTDYLLDDIKEFSKGDQIVLSKDVENAESFPLIRVIIDKNRKRVVENTVGIRGKGKPKYEAHLQRYTRETMGISLTRPNYDKEYKSQNNKFYQYVLGERYLYKYVDIEPDCSALERKLEIDTESAFKVVDDKYESIILNKVKEFVVVKEKESLVKNEYSVKEYSKKLQDSLDGDAKENNDKEIQTIIEKKVRNLTTSIKTTFEKKKSDIDKKIKELEKGEEKERKDLSTELNELSNKYKLDCETAANSINVLELYKERNSLLVEKKRKNLEIEHHAEIKKLTNQKRKEVELQYSGQVKNEKEKEKNSLLDAFNIAKAKLIEEETIRSYHIYFRPADSLQKVDSLKKDIERTGYKFLTFDNRAEKAKILRQQKALESLTGGYVKNPFLISYLFSPESLTQNNIEVENDFDWCLESLNDSQKLAVSRALRSESIFLLQGPPGTGKTQVIAEITAQLTKKGKKVLISSETHKAIDNVFERLPKIPEIRPLRLIPSINKKETNYSPEKLVDNFYINIGDNLHKQIKRFENFEETKFNFNEIMNRLRAEYNKVLILQKDKITATEELSVLKSQIITLNKKLEVIRNEELINEEELQEYSRTIKAIERYQFNLDDVKANYLTMFKIDLDKLTSTFKSLNGFDITLVGEVVKVNLETLREEINLLNPKDRQISLERSCDDLRQKLQKLRDPDTDEAPSKGDKNYNAYTKYQNELISATTELKELNKKSDINLSNTVIFQLFRYIMQDKEILSTLVKDISVFRIRLQELITKMIDQINKDKSKFEITKKDLKSRKTNILLELNDLKKRNEELLQNVHIIAHNELNSKLKQEIHKFFYDFNIIQEYDPNNLESAFEIIFEEWKKIEKEYSENKKENAIKIVMYKEISKYLNQDDILEEDRNAYTRELFNNVNVFGITCTSRDKFTKYQLESFTKYGIESVDIRTQGIDVVIVDEVSKSSFLDLVIPILYGKTVILVGDHRQLPPMYDLRNMRENDFEDLDNGIITYKINDSYKKMYEDCFFKNLYEKVPEDFRVMLNKQYRCHSHIMGVFNHFYGGNQNGLKIGKSNQDNEKEHNLLVKINSNTIIDPHHHIYFIDCDHHESSAYEGSTSKINEQEAEVVIKLLKELDKASVKLISDGKIQRDQEKKIDNRVSVGVICTYGDQASLIKKKRKHHKFNGFSTKHDEKLVISTVDDFQGDERDIIIVSMVRNPSKKNFDLDFIKKFERINVALSRSRKMLIVIGSKKFLSENGIIDLPDLTGNKSLDRKNFHVYQEIIDTIDTKGRVLTANDILGD